MTDIGVFELYFEASYIKKIFYKVALQKGTHVEKINEIFSERDLDDLKEKKLLRFLTTNAKKFKKGE